MERQHTNLQDSVKPGAPFGARLHRFTVDEYRRMTMHGILRKDDPTELNEGRLCIKLENRPPYDVPFRIPPEQIVGCDLLDLHPQRRFTVREYHKLMSADVFPLALRTELVEGWVIDRANGSPMHATAQQMVAKVLRDCIGVDRHLRERCGATLDDGETEPDVAVVRGPDNRYDHRHPGPCDIELLVEISDTTLAFDGGPKLRDYARNGTQLYLILNIIHRQVEEYEDPSGPTDEPEYRTRRVYKQSESIELVLDGKKLKPIPVNDLLSQ